MHIPKRDSLLRHARSGHGAPYVGAAALEATGSRDRACVLPRAVADQDLVALIEALVGAAALYLVVYAAYLLSDWWRRVVWWWNARRDRPVREALGGLPDRVEIERRADALRSRLPQQGPPVDVDYLLALLGVTDVIVAEIKQDALLVGGPLEGFLMAVLNRNSVPVRRRFSLAHEAGHLVLDPDRRSQGYLHPVAARPTRDPLERACDYFAACLLMPREWIQGAAEVASGTQQLARIFYVSQDAMRIRLRELGHNDLSRR